MKKKIFAFGLAAAMSVTAVGLMAGCGDRVSDGSTIRVAVAREASSGTREVFEEKVSKNGVSIADWLDEEGNAIIEYYTPDSTAPEDIIIEGIDENGKVYRLTQTINK